MKNKYSGIYKWFKLVKCPRCGLELEIHITRLDSPKGYRCPFCKRALMKGEKYED